MRVIPEVLDGMRERVDGIQQLIGDSQIPEALKEEMAGHAFELKLMIEALGEPPGTPSLEEP